MEKTGTTKKEVVTAFRTREILGAARRLLAQRSLEAITMEDIAQAAGVAKGTVYLYFQGKDELIQALLSQVGETLAQKLEVILAGPQPAPEKLREVVTMFLRHLEEERGLFPLYLRELVRSRSGRQTPLSPKLRDLEERFIRLLAGMFAEGSATGQFIQAEPRLLAYILKGLVKSVGYFQMSGNQAGAVKEALPVVLQLLFSGVVRAACPEDYQRP